MNKTIEVQTEYGPVVVRKLALYDYAELLRSIKKLPGEFSSFIEGNSKDKLQDLGTFLEAVPEITANALPEFGAMLASCTDKDGEFIGQLDLADTIDVLVAILELNDYKRIVASIKKLMALRTKQPAPAPQAPPEQPQS